MQPELVFQPRDKRIGLIVPSSNTNMEPDFSMLCPDEVTIHGVRSGGYDVEAIPDAKEMRRYVRLSIDQNIKDLTDSRVNIIAYGCTSATLAEGPEFDAEFCQEITNKAGVPAVTTAGALVEAVKKMGAKRVAFTSPYVKALAADAISYLENSEIDVVNCLSFDKELSSLEQNALTPQDAYDMAIKSDHKDAQAIVISCTDYRALEAIPAIEATLNKPVITSNQALMYACLQRLGVEYKSAEVGGRLFA